MGGAAKCINQEKKKKKSVQWSQMGPTVGSGLTLELEAGTLVNRCPYQPHLFS